MGGNRDMAVSDANLRRIIEMSPDAVITLSEAGIILFVNPAAEQLFGRPAFEMVGTEFGFPVPGKEIAEIEVISKSEVLQTAEMRLVDIEWEGDKALLLTLRNVTERKKLENQQRLAHEILTLLNRAGHTKEIICDILKQLKETTALDAVAIRLRQDNDFPYYAADGFSEEYRRTERSLCARTETGEIKQDASGNPLLEGMCGNILRGRIDPDQPFFTEWGSFWTNNSTRFLASTTEADRLTRTRNRCNEEGYESVALIPLRNDEEIIGFLQLNDHRPDRFTLGMILFFERLGASIGAALARKKMQQQLVEEKDFIGKALNSLADIFFVIDLKGKIIRWNKTLNAITGYLDTEIDSMMAIDFIHPDDRERLSAAIQTALQQGSASLETLLLTKGGRQIPYEVRGVRLSDSHGRPVGISGMGRDITEQKHTESALGERIKELGCINAISRLANEPWMSIEELARQVVAVLPPSWKYPEVCVARITLDATEFKTADFRETTWRQAADILVDRKKYGTITICYLEEKPSEDEGPFLKEERSLLDTIADFLGHIIQHRRSEEAIRESEERFRIIFDSSNDGILLADAETKKFFFGNAAICRLLGYDREEIKTVGVMDIHPEEDLAGVLQTFEKQSGNEVESIQTFPVKRKDGSVFFADVNTARVELSGRPYVLGIFRDITERKKFEDQLRQSQKLQAIGTLAGGIAHDFNNILTSILGYSDLAEGEIANGNAKQAKEDLQRVNVAAQRAVDLVRQILTISRQSERRVQPLKIQYIVKEALKLLRPSISTSIAIKSDIDPDCPTILADPTQIHQVIMNLCTNGYHAIRDVERGDHALEIGLTTIVLDEAAVQDMTLHVPAGRFVRLTVSDTGCGMEAATMARIFDPYFTTKKRGEGTGLGLATVHSIVESEGGAVTVSSEIGKGTTFAVYFPVYEEDLRETVQAEEVKAVTGGSERIMVIDDEVPIAQLLQRRLAGYGYQTSAFCDCAEAVQVFMGDPMAFDLVITDMQMPKVMGTDLARIFLEERADLPIILCTGYSEKIDLDRARAIGIRELLYKPVDIIVLADLVRRILNENQSNAQQPFTV